MRMRGLTYDTGFLSEGTSTHSNFDAARVYRRWKLYGATCIALP